MNAIDKELLPCPFCESDKLDFSLKISTRGYNKQPSLYHGVIYCKNCHAYGQRVLCYSEEQYRYSDDEKKTFYEQAVKAWNTRTPPADTVCISRAELEGMREPETAVRIAEYTKGFGDGLNNCIDKLLNKQEDGE